MSPPLYISHSASCRFLLLLCYAIAIIFYATTALAAAGDACTNNGAIEREGGQTLICDGTAWNLATEIEVGGKTKLRIAEETDPCINAIIGQLRYNSVSGAIEYCDGSSWVSTLSKPLTDLSDVDVGSPADGTLLGWDAVSGKWVAVCSNFPNDFSFTNISGAGLGSLVESDIQSITGLSCPDTSISISGQGSPQYRVCSDGSCSSVIQAWTSATNTVVNGNYVQIRLTASSESSIIHTATLTIGTANRSWSVSTPDSVTFKRVFVVDNQFTGAFGGLAGADQICQNRAIANNYPGTFYAWLATGAADDPESRFTQATVEYRDPLDRVVAYNWIGLTSGGLARYFDTREGGAGDTGWDKWTNVAADGTAKYDGTNNCLNWTSSSNSLMGHVGRSNTTSAEWTDHDLMPCDSAEIRLICVQQ